jgi:hypothetical protein
LTIAIAACPVRTRALREWRYALGVGGRDVQVVPGPCARDRIEPGARCPARTAGLPSGVPLALREVVAVGLAVPP